MFFGSLKPPWRHLSYNEPNCQAMVACILVQLVICDGFGLYKVQPPSGANYCDILTWNRPIRFESCRHVIRCRTIKYEYCITMFRSMTHLKMTHCFTVCVWKCLLYLFFPLFILEQMGPFQCHLRWWWSHFSTSDGRRTCRPGAPRAGTGSARQCRGGSPMAANTSHVQCEWCTYDSIQGWRCRFHALGRQGGRWLREFLWPHSHFSEDFWLREVLSVEELVFWCVWLWVPWVFQSLVSDPFYPASGDPGSCGTCWCLHALYFFTPWYQPLMN